MQDHDGNRPHGIYSAHAVCTGLPNLGLALALLLINTIMGAQT
jgi:hypothetical protein